MTEEDDTAAAAPGRPKQGQPPRGAATREAAERGGTNTQARNPLHGVTLEAMVTALADHYGWDGLGERIPVRCFNVDPSVGSSLRFLRKTPWAREKVEGLYLFMLREERRAGRG
ncbi:MAG: VF530 family protein [Hydrogenophaga sp.]|nr:VF530 family protein [Hydrogenophaga sp.]